MVLATKDFISFGPSLYPLVIRSIPCVVNNLSTSLRSYSPGFVFSKFCNVRSIASFAFFKVVPMPSNCCASRNASDILDGLLEFAISVILNRLGVAKVDSYCG